MFAIAFDLVVADTAQHHTKRGVASLRRHRPHACRFRIQPGARQPLHDALGRFGPSEDLANLFGAITALKALPWFPPSVRDIRAFRVEQWSDFTKLVKG